HKHLRLGIFEVQFAVIGAFETTGDLPLGIRSIKTGAFEKRHRGDNHGYRSGAGRWAKEYALKIMDRAPDYEGTAQIGRISWAKPDQLGKRALIFSTSAADLKFLHHLPPTRSGTSN